MHDDSECLAVAVGVIDPPASLKPSPMEWIGGTAMAVVALVLLTVVPLVGWPIHLA